MFITSYDILHIDLSQPLEAIEHQARPIYVLLWWQTVPLGQVVLLPEDLPMSAAAFANIAAAHIRPAVKAYLDPQTLDARGGVRISTDLSAALDRLVVQPALPAEKSAPSVSVVVCTRDRPEQLVDCLRSLAALTSPADEIIVVDNAPRTLETRKVVEQFEAGQFEAEQFAVKQSEVEQSEVEPLKKVRYVLEPQPGLSRARNTGIAHARSDIVAFTDDDVCVHPGWLQPIRAAFQNEKVMAATGIVLPTTLASETQVLFELSYGYLNHGYKPRIYDETFLDHPQRKGIHVWEIGAGANMAFRREVFDRVGLFDLRLGAGASGCSEDSEMWYRILASGGYCQYVPAAVVYHTHRPDAASFKQQMRAYMRGHVVALLIQFAQFKHPGNLRRLFVEIPYFFWHHLKPAIRHRFRNRYQSYGSELLGYLSGIPTYLKLTYGSKVRF